MNIGEMIEKIYSVTYGDDPGKFTVGDSSGYNGNSKVGTGKSITLTGTEGLLCIASSGGNHPISLTSGSCEITELFTTKIDGYGSTGSAAYLIVYQYKNNKSATYNLGGSFGNGGSVVCTCLTY